MSDLTDHIFSAVEFGKRHSLAALKGSQQDTDLNGLEHVPRQVTCPYPSLTKN